jgi:hypothetical protein
MKKLLGTLRILRAVLQEIFDEAPYARFLQRSELASSPAAYAAFLREHRSSPAPRPRCC